ncbi:unnamed protein product [Adineta steineri]|uniref:Methyltransferase FkbM domain-containing protein n=1 Tax=Adineta steineri TaxID=433720 RepID=A0A813W558_9BILA|nr:unnamed protein product [Adineta steineri]CAF3666889.1 unnamed protein product [Adineta steineri]
MQTNKSLSIINISEINMYPSHKTNYFDYEPYLNSNNTSMQTTNRTRRFFYIDLGCFDGRDIDHFLHFHKNEALSLGNLYIITFEPDPINYPVCKSKQTLPKSVNRTVYNAAVWIKNGKVRYATERGQKSRVDKNSAIYVHSIDFSQWLIDNFFLDDYLHVKFTIEGAEIDVLEKMVIDRSLSLIDYLEIEWTSHDSPDLEPRRIVLESMFDVFGMDFLYITNPVDLKHAHNLNDTYIAVPKDKVWKLRNPLTRFHYKTRKDVSVLLTERLKRKKQQMESS